MHYCSKHFGKLNFYFWFSLMRALWTQWFLTMFDTIPEFTASQHFGNNSVIFGFSKLHCRSHFAYHFLVTSTISSWNDAVNLNLAARLPTLCSLFHTKAIVTDPEFDLFPLPRIPSSDCSTTTTDQEIDKLVQSRKCWLLRLETLQVIMKEVRNNLQSGISCITSCLG